ncbi:hypothetical protein [Lentzea sp. NPDC059081]|uniref:hypothetical protein n=1 Tax=Lentzea sp. NPDC059081 TaxID=3346719 RepID=UPI0036745413
MSRRVAMRRLDPGYDKRAFDTSQMGLSAVVRAKAHDDWARGFLADHPDAVVLHPSHPHRAVPVLTHGCRSRRDRLSTSDSKRRTALPRLPQDHPTISARQVSRSLSTTNPPSGATFSNVTRTAAPLRLDHRSGAHR